MKKEALKIVKAVAEFKVGKNEAPWPPACTTLLHQPRRPEKKMVSGKKLKNQR